MLKSIISLFAPKQADFVVNARNMETGEVEKLTTKAFFRGRFDYNQLEDYVTKELYKKGYRVIDMQMEECSLVFN